MVYRTDRPAPAPVTRLDAATTSRLVTVAANQQPLSENDRRLMIGEITVRMDGDLKIPVPADASDVYVRSRFISMLDRVSVIAARADTAEATTPREPSASELAGEARTRELEATRLAYKQLTAEQRDSGRLPSNVEIEARAEQLAAHRRGSK